MDDQDVVLLLLNGLGPEFDPMVSGITSRSDTLSLEEIQALLMSHESRLERHHTMGELSMKMAVDLSLTPFLQFNNGGYRSSGNFGRGGSTDSGSRSYGRGYARGALPFNRLLCQVCLQFGHSVVVFHYCFDKNFITPKYGSSQPKAYLIEQEFEYEPHAHDTTSIL
ncbi:uncharacterized protein LOC133833878 [Humulus lupulus]|uniref:uncharacterized protein LOC133833878 n=1 Tax=Humulus lupulus TaxID=3486 RepID=UPI002B401320|nr:uncharacterized protein LOC133833878 [Humulus lupulus]